ARTPSRTSATAPTSAARCTGTSTSTTRTSAGSSPTTAESASGCPNAGRKWGRTYFPGAATWGRTCLRPVVGHQLAHPRGLADVPARQEPAHHGLDVDDGRAVDRVELGDVDAAVADAHEPRDADTEPVRSVLAALGEDADLRPGGVATRMARAAH